MATLATNVSFQCLGLDGKPLAGGKVYSYAAGTTTNKATYTTMAGTVANPNPITLDQNGKAKIFLGDGAYRLRIFDKNGAMIDDIDQISRYVTQSEFASFQQTVNDGVAQLTEVREQIDVYVNASIGDQKGFANGIAPLDANVKIDPIYFPTVPHSGVPQATETQIGVAEVATQSETIAGTNDATIITPKKLKDISFGRTGSYANVTASRSGDTVYTNPKNTPLVVAITAGAQASTASNKTSIISGDLEAVYASTSAGSMISTQIVIVPPLAQYKLNNPLSIVKWMEW